MAKIKKLAIIQPDVKASPSTVITYAKAVHKGMSDNAATFPAPPITMEDFKKAIDAAEAAVVPEADRSENTDKKLDKLIKDLRKLLETLATYVLFVADGDRHKAGLSGFELNKEETTTHNPGEFKAKFMKPGPNPGTAIVRIEERAGSAFFIVKRKMGDDWVMIDAFNTLLFTVEGLPSGESTLLIYGKKGTEKSPEVQLVVRAS